jgi:hypothetical protein
MYHTILLEPITYLLHGALMAVAVSLTMIDNVARDSQENMWGIEDRGAPWVVLHRIVSGIRIGIHRTRRFEKLFCSELGVRIFGPMTQCGHLPINVGAGAWR